MKRLVAFLVVLLAAAAAALVVYEKSQDEARKGKRKDDVGIRDFIDYATGKTPIEQGRKLKKQIREIEAERKRRLDEVMK